MAWKRVRHHAAGVKWPPGGAMARGALHTTGLRYGWSLPRTTGGQQLYLRACDPRAGADVVVTNDDPLQPALEINRPHT